jgi:small GTP-binding protein
MEEMTFKIMLAGEVNVGKTTAIKRFVSKTFNTESKSTIGVDFAFKRIQINETSPNQEEKTVVLQIWDVAGERRFRDILPFYISGMKGIILAFDCTSHTTLEALNEWINLIEKHLDLSTIPIMLISTKHDLTPQVRKEEIAKFLRKHRIIHYYPTSSVTGRNIETVFTKISQLMIQTILQTIEAEKRIMIYET